MMSIFGNKLVKNGRYIGRKYIFEDGKYHKLDLKKGISMDDLIIILNHTKGYGYFDKMNIEELPEHLWNNFRKMTMQEFDGTYNPEMEIDE